MADLLNLLMFACAFGLLLLGYPVAFTLAAVALAFAFIGHALGVFPIGHLSFMAQRMYAIMSNHTLVAVPLFVFMGLMLERSKIAEDLLTGMARLFGGRAGGLTISVTVVGALLAASTGIVGATVVTMGLLALPVMLQHGYAPRLATGTICASGTLGQIIPPSIVLVFLGDFLSHAAQQANMRSGNIGGAQVSVSDLFAGAMLPGLMLVGLYLLYVGYVAWRRPASCPPVGQDDPTQRHDLRSVLGVLVAPIALILAVLGSILGGIATPTEAAAVGAVGAIVLGAKRSHPGIGWLLALGGAAAVALVTLNFAFDLRMQRTHIPTADRIAIGVALAAAGLMGLAIVAAIIATFKNQVMADVVRRTARITAMVFTILIGASLLTLVFRGFGGETAVKGFFDMLPGGLAGAMLFTMIVIFLLGFFLDFLEIIFIVIPIVAPILIMMGADPVWLGVMIAVNLQTSFLTPPFGFALFYLRSVVPAGIATTDIYRGAVPFIFIQVFALAMVASFPALATWLPRALF